MFSVISGYSSGRIDDCSVSISIFNRVSVYKYFSINNSMDKYTKYHRLRAALLISALMWSLPALAERYQIGYFEGGESAIFTSTWQATKKALVEMGWGDQVEYPQNAHYSPGFGHDRLKEREAAAREIMGRTELSLIVSAGTDATELLQKYNNHKTPVLGIAISDPIRSKFVIDQNDSGIDNFTTRLIPKRYVRMFRVFHDEVGFKRLGLLYVDHPNSRKFANVADAMQVAGERGYAVVHYKIDDTLTPDECMDALKSLVAQKIDAFYIPSLTCFEWQHYDVAKYLNYLMKNRIPTFARQGTEDVKAGGLMGVSTVDYSQRGGFLATMIRKILKGTSPRKLKMVDEAIPKIAINLYVAQQIEFDPSFEILGASDELYNEITLPPNRLK